MAMKKLDILKTAFDGYKKDIISKLYDFVDSLPYKCIQLNSKPLYRIMYNRTYEKGKVWIPPNISEEEFYDQMGKPSGIRDLVPFILHISNGKLLFREIIDGRNDSGCDKLVEEDLSMDEINEIIKRIEI